MENGYSKRNITHTYLDVGIYEGNLTVRQGNVQDTVNFTVNVEQRQIEINLQFPDQTTLGEQVAFDATSSVSGDVERIEWIIDGVRYTEENLRLSFDESGSYLVTLYAIDSAGNLYSDSSRILVEESSG